jgi:hypothetical protein
MKYPVLVLALMLSGCSTVVPIEKKFPVAPEVLLQKCPDLMVVDDGKNSLREMLKVVIQNYATYYQCAEKTEGWQTWYKEQKKIFNGDK